MLKLTIDDFITATGPYHNTNNINEAMNILKDTSNVVPTFALTRTKTNKFHYTFCTPEAVTSIVNYLYSRKDKLTPESPLFKVSYQHLTIKFEHLNEALNLGVTMGNSYAVLRCHTLRKYHATTLRDDGLSIDIINSLQGKTKNKVDRAYYVDTPEKLKEMYMDHMNSLAIGDEYRFRTKMETITEGLSCNIITYSEVQEADYSAANIAFDALGNASFDLVKYGENIGRIQLSVAGKHNVSNAF